ncbi:alpha/beta fold hydrolase [Brevibacterium daeguense]|uniref:Alpha/beta fold hydrolase n=2 Tax=Brevibacterium daeguense TaxID=909936 RepID=A0ABP8EKD9_9MICO
MRRRAEQVPGLKSIRRPISWTETGADHTADTAPGVAPAAETTIAQAGRGTPATAADPFAPSAAGAAAAGFVGPEFDLSYIRLGSEARAGRLPFARGAGGRKRAGASAAESLPVVVIPGGPGLASALPYLHFRRAAAASGLDVVMVEHRGVGLSRHDLLGHDLPLEAMQISLVVDDIAAVLTAEGIEQAVIVGSSYGSYLAQGLAVSHPELVAGLVLDSPMLSVVDDRVGREYARDLLLRGTVGGPETRLLAAKIHDLVDSGTVDEQEFGRNVRIIFEFAGPDVLDQYLNQLRLGRVKQTEALLERLGTSEVSQTMPCIMEFDLVGQIWFRELKDPTDGDGAIFDSSHEFDAVRDRYGEFVGEPYRLAQALPEFDVPVLVLSGDRDLRTPRPVAEEIVRLAPEGMLIDLPGHGHSALDTHMNAVLAAAEAVAAGRAGELAWQPDRFTGLKRTGGPSLLVGRTLAAALTADRLLPR